MDILTTVIVLLPSVLSSIISLLYAYIAYKKSKEPPKDEIWETATKIICNSTNSISGADDFADIYEQLKFFKDNGCSTKGIQTLAYAVRNKNKEREGA